MNVSLYQGDCLDIMPTLPAASVDLVLCDLPYGTTACKWDSVIDLPSLWSQYKRVCTGVVALTAAQPFTSVLVCSNLPMFRYQWVWLKSRAMGFHNAKLQPMRKHEDVLVFSEHRCAPGCLSPMLYNPQGLTPYGKLVNGRKSCKGDAAGHSMGRASDHDFVQEFTNYPVTTLDIPNEGKTVHPTQKPVALMEYLIRTYTNPGDTVLDNCMGSGTTGVACVNTGRSFIGIEMDPSYFTTASARIAAARTLKEEA